MNDVLGVLENWAMKECPEMFAEMLKKYGK